MSCGDYQRDMGIAFWIRDCHAAESSIVCFSETSATQVLLPELLRFLSWRSEMGEQSRKSGNAVSAFPALPVRNFILSLQFAKNAGQFSLTSKSQPKKNLMIFPLEKNIYLVNKSSDRFNSTSKNSQGWMDSLAAVSLFAAVRCGFWAAPCRISHTKVAELASRLPVFLQVPGAVRTLSKSAARNERFHDYCPIQIRTWLPKHKIYQRFSLIVTGKFLREHITTPEEGELPAMFSYLHLSHSWEKVVHWSTYTCLAVNKIHHHKNSCKLLEEEEDTVISTMC